MNRSMIFAEKILGGRTLILGDVNTGKTTLTRNLLEELCRRRLGDKVAVLDLAPDIPAEIAAEKGLTGVGGKLQPPEGCGVLYLGGPFAPPRLSSKTETEAREKARCNRRRIETLFRRLDRRPRKILLINDVSIALQAGTAQSLIRRLERVETVVANGYWGERLGGGALTAQEQNEMGKLKTYFEKTGQVLMLERRFR